MMLTPFPSVDAARRAAKALLLLWLLSLAVSISALVLNDVPLMPGVMMWLSVSAGITASQSARIRKIKAAIGRQPTRQEFAEALAHSAAGEAAPDRELQDAMVKYGAAREAVFMVVFLMLVGGGAAAVGAASSTSYLGYALTAFAVVIAGVASYLGVKFVAGYMALARRGS